MAGAPTPGNASFNTQIADCGLEQRREALQESIWRMEEQDLERRVALLEHVLRKASGIHTAGLDVHVDSAGAKGAGHELAGGGQTFATAFQGPFVSRGKALEQGIYIDVEKSAIIMEQTHKHQVQEDHQKARKSDMPVTAFLAGDYRALFG
eukprot:TRINITY_DN5276_c0_g4_i1.p1 TRINITY_DN5276_c0_g4~~TRINITY_DN5276_c0_g4_i1.p1  ORF type:complete len:151 (+),score=34.70 TRINITY_DN5276_c0_g4_i1:63-515(+)